MFWERSRRRSPSTVNVAVDQLAELDDLFLGQVANLAVRLDTDLGEQLIRRRAADPIDIGEPDLDSLVEGDVDAGDTCHVYLALTLLMTRI